MDDINKIIDNAQNKVSGKTKSDWSDLIVVDTAGQIFDKGQVLSVSIGVLKDENGETITEMLTQLFKAVGLELKEKEGRAVKVAKTMDISKILKAS